MRPIGEYINRGFDGAAGAASRRGLFEKSLEQSGYKRQVAKNLRPAKWLDSIPE
jgi:hypothetical protein